VLLSGEVVSGHQKAGVGMSKIVKMHNRRKRERPKNHSQKKSLGEGSKQELNIEQCWKQ